MLRPAALFVGIALSFVAIACTNDAESEPTNLPQVPTPVASLNREDCEAVGATDYFLSDEEREWFTENCNRIDCEQIRGTQYLSNVERTWYLEECS